MWFRTLLDFLNDRSRRTRDWQPRPRSPTVLCVERLEDRCLFSAGALDLGFGTNGVAAFGPASGTGSLAAIALAPDGKIVAGGLYAAPYSKNVNLDFALCRFLSDGAVDSSFGADGWVTTGFGGTSDDRVRAVAVLPDGRVLAGGYSDQDFALVRYTAAGAVDTTFGGKAKGKVVTDITYRSNDNPQAIVVQADGKIVLAGSTYPRNSSFPDLAVVRYNANGSLDTSFDGDGKLTVRFASALQSEAQNVDVAVYPATAPGGLEGKLVVAAAISYPSSNVTLTRFNADGSRDMSFGGGTGSVSIGSGWRKPHVAIQPDGKIVLSANFYGGFSQWAMLARLDTAGNLDAGFGTGGVTETHLNNLSVTQALALQPDGKILVSANEHVAQSPPNQAFDYPLVLRYDASGMLDPTFGTNGKVIQTVTTFQSNVFDLALQPDGRILLGGFKSTPGLISEHRFDFVLLRLQGDAGMAATAAAPAGSADTLSAAAAQSLLGEASRRWQAAGADASGLKGIDIRIADLGGTTLGLASDNSIWLDDNAAGWGWFVDPTPRDDSEFTTPGNQGEQGKMDLLTVLGHEIGHLLGKEHEASGVMQETLTTGTRLVDSHPDWHAALDVVFSEVWSKKRPVRS